MFNLFKIKIPKDNAQEITEMESYTVSWEHTTNLRWGDSKISNKVFIHKHEAIEFEKQLHECANFIKSPVRTELVKN